VYVYRRRDGSTFELQQRITVDALVICPTTGQAVERIMQPFSPRYTGTGFYSTDHPKATQPASRTDRDPAAGAGRDQSSAPTDSAAAADA
jgi:predicted nucleic acid-binding Zn ribbon protein